MTKDKNYGSTRFIGGHIPIEMFEAMEASRGEHGIDSRSEVIRQAMALWVQKNPPDSGVSKAMAELMKVTTSSKAVRETVDQAVREWRVSHDDEILRKLRKLSNECGGLNLAGDIKSAINNLQD